MRAIWTFPAVFTATPAVIFQLREVNATPNLTHITLNRIGALGASSGELIAYRQIGQTNFAVGDTATAAALAIGTWK